MPSFATILAVPELSRLLTGYLEPDVLLCKQVQLSKPSPEQHAQALRGSLRRSRMELQDAHEQSSEDIYRIRYLEDERAVLRHNLEAEEGYSARFAKHASDTHTRLNMQILELEEERARLARELDFAARELAIANEYREIYQTRCEILHNIVSP